MTALWTRRHSKPKPANRTCTRRINPLLTLVTWNVSDSKGRHEWSPIHFSYCDHQALQYCALRVPGGLSLAVEPAALVGILLPPESGFPPCSPYVAGSCLTTSHLSEYQEQGGNAVAGPKFLMQSSNAADGRISEIRTSS